MKEKKYTVTNEKFSQEPWTGTAKEIIENIISYNTAWETDYSKNDFYENSNGLLCRDEIIAAQV